MQNYLMNSFARVGSAVAFAALAGCSTMSNPTHRDNSCVVGEETTGLVLAAIPFKRDAAEEYSLSCREGRAAAQTTYVGKDVNGNLHPKSAVISLAFNKEVQDRIKTSIENGEGATQKYYQDVKYFFDFYLQKIGGQTVDKIQEYVDKLKADAAIARAQAAAASQAPAAPKPAPRCGTGNGVIRSCPPESVKTPTPE